MRAVNLLPAERKKREPHGLKLTRMHGIGVGIIVGAVALGYWGHNVNGQADAEQAKIDQLDAQTQSLTAQIATAKASKSTTVSTYESDQALVSGLAAARVNWSTVMINLARVAPKGVWLSSMAVTTPTSDAQTAAPSTPETKRPAAITLDASATSRTAAALFLSRLNGIAGFVDPRLSGGINPVGGDDATAESFKFTVEIPVDDSIFGPGTRPTAPPAASTQSTATPSPQP
jgi:Tfp pilus assembly protein PilN